MKLKPQVVVVGLGRFGKSFASKMYNLGHDVMAIDIDPDKVQSMVGQVTYPVTTDASSEMSLRELGVQDFDVGVVALADVEVSIMVSVLFKTLDIKNIIARASSDLHKDTLIRLGCNRVVFAEDEMGEQLANTIRLQPNLIKVSLCRSEDALAIMFFMSRVLKSTDTIMDTSTSAKATTPTSKSCTPNSRNDISEEASVVTG
jgi:Trk K+ transport system NAD-binding subunit